MIQHHLCVAETAVVTIRPPAVLRLYAIAFMVVWSGGVIWTTMVRGRGAAPAVGALFLLFGGTLCYRLVRQAVLSRPDGVLEVRNVIGGRHLQHDQIEDFRLGQAGGKRFGQRSIQVLLTDGTVYALDVTRSGPFGLRAKTAERQLRQLKDWLAS